MKLRVAFGILFLGLIFCAMDAFAAGGPRLGEPGLGNPIDKSGDAVLQKMIREVAPKFSQGQFEKNGIILNYNLFVPENMEPGKNYPMVMFIADASTPGSDVKKPLTQGYGALVWATPESQKRHPCYVLVPQFSGVTVNDKYQRTPEAEIVPDLLKNIAASHKVDRQRLYSTGQSMGGMMAMYYNINNPGIFAASLFVDCHWDTTGFDKLVETPFIFFYAGSKGKAWHMKDAIENAARAMGKSYTWAEWSARLPLEEQDELAQTMLSKNQTVNIFGFENGTVLPESGKGSEHMYSFDKVYRLTPVREWLFKHELAKPGI